MLEDFFKKTNTTLSEKDILYKNLYFNEYYYFSSVKAKFTDFKNFLKITNLGLKLKNENFYLLSKPYNILNNNSFNLPKYNPYVLVVHDL